MVMYGGFQSGSKITNFWIFCASFFFFWFIIAAHSRSHFLPVCFSGSDCVLDILLENLFIEIM